MLTVAGGDWWNVAAAADAEKTMMMMMTVAVAVLAAVHPIPNCCWGLRRRWPAMALLKTVVVTMMTETTTVRAEYGRANGPAGEVHMGQALHFQPQQLTCGAHLRVDGASGPGEVPGELLIAPWSLIRQPPLRFICMLFHRKSWKNPHSLVYETD